MKKVQRSSIPSIIFSFILGVISLVPHGWSARQPDALTSLRGGYRRAESDRRGHAPMSERDPQAQPSTPDSQAASASESEQSEAASKGVG